MIGGCLIPFLIQILDTIDALIASDVTSEVSVDVVRPVLLIMVEVHLTSG